MIVFDIETVPDEEAIKSRQWAEYKVKKGIVDDQDAALHPVFGQIVCVCAYSVVSGRSLSVCSPNESEIIEQTANFFSLHSNQNLAGHNIKGFDIPFLCCKRIKHRIRLPPQLNVSGKKPWEINHVDTVELMQFGKGPYLSLDQICLLLGVESPKEGEVNALGVWDAFKSGKYEEIQTYCKADVRAWYSCYKKIMGSI